MCMYLKSYVILEHRLLCSQGVFEVKEGRKERTPATRDPKETRDPS